MANELMNESKAAEWLGVSVATLRRRRQRKEAPQWVKVGSRVLYRKLDLENFVEASVVKLTTAKRKGVA